jgi:PAS domain S-box-containing protein
MQALSVIVLHFTTYHASKYFSINFFPYGIIISLALMLLYNAYSPLSISFVGFSVSLVFYSIFLIKTNWLQYLYISIIIISAFVSEVYKGTDYEVALMVLIPSIGFTSLFYTAIIHLQNTHLQLSNNYHELCKAKSELRLLVENTNANIWSVDKNYRYMKGNSKFENYLFILYNKAILLNQNILEFTEDSEDKLFWKKIYDRGLKGEVFTLEKEKIINNDLFTFEINVSPMYDNTHQVYGVNILSKNITKKKLFEKQRVDNQKFLDIVLNEMPIGFELFNAEGFLIRMNDKQMKNLGISKPLNYINNYNILTDSFSLSSGQYEYYKKAFDTGDVINYEITINFDSPDNPFPNKKSISIFEVNLFSIKGEDGIIRGLVALTSDISLRKHNEQLLIEQNKRFEEYSFTLSHVIRKPIANLISLTSLLHEYADLDAEDQRTLDYVHDSVQELDGIIRTLNSKLNSNSL